MRVPANSTGSLPKSAAREGRAGLLAAIQRELRSEVALIFGALTTLLFYTFPAVLLAGFAPDRKTIVLFLNILLGSALATISVTAPAVLVIGLVTGRGVELGLEPVEMIMLLLTLAVSTLSFTDGKIIAVPFTSCLWPLES